MGREAAEPTLRAAPAAEGGGLRAAALGAAGLALIFVAANAGPLPLAALLAAAGAAMLVSAAVLTFSGFSARAGVVWPLPGRGAAQAFRVLHHRAEAPMLLTDGRGRLLAANAEAEAQGARAGARLEDLLGDGGEASARFAYRLLRAARRDGLARASVTLGGRGWRAVALPTDDGLTLWRLAPEAADGRAGARERLAEALLEGGAPLALRRPGGVRLDAAARALVETAPDPADPPFEQAPPRDGVGLVSLRGGPDCAAVPVSPPEGEGWALLPLPGAGASSPGASALLEQLPVPIARLALDGELLETNAAARQLLGPRARPGARLATLAEGLGRPMKDRLEEAARGRSTGRAEIARARDGERELFLQLSFSRVSVGGEPSLIAVLNDATELKTLEAQFVQSQKMQAVGQLAGGVAHDFNNLLTAINGHCDLLLMRRDAADADHADLIQIRQNANRAAALVRQMLAFSRKQTLRPSVVNLAETLEELSHLLNRLLGENVRLTLEHDPELGLVRVDERQFEQVVMNLAVNARDAMPGGGEVRVRSRNIAVADERRRDRAVIPAGEYVSIEVSDDGVGIPPDRLEQLFEPFFTTKKPGEGTGLGLSTAYGIVKQTGGFIFADSPEEGGAVFTVLLPRHRPEAAAPAEREAAPETPAADPAPDPGGDGVVLLVEDEAPVRSFAARALRLRGWEVIEAACAEEALAAIADPARRVDVIVSDVVMPGLDGPSWVKQARETRPDTAVVFVSGYAEDAFRRSLDGLDRFNFLPKPFSLAELTDAVRAAAPASPAGAEKAEAAPA